MENNMKSQEVINKFNYVEGFYPEEFLEKRTDEEGDDEFYLPVSARVLWFRLKYSNGKIKKELVQFTPEYAVVKTTIFLDKNDEHFVSSAYGHKMFIPGDVYGENYLETAETMSVGRALDNIGFSTRVLMPKKNNNDVDIDGNSKADSPVKTTKSENESKKTNSSNKGEKAKPKNQKVTKGDEEEKKSENGQENVEKAEQSTDDVEEEKYTKDMSIEEIKKLMTSEEAKNMIIDAGKWKGSTVLDVAQKDIKSLEWYATKMPPAKRVLMVASMMVLENYNSEMPQAS